MRVLKNLLKLLSLLIIICFATSSPHVDPYHPRISSRSMKSTQFNDIEKETDYWLKLGKDFVKKQIGLKYNMKKAKNIIYFVGDGMSLTTLAASRLLLGDENKSLFFESFEHTGLAKTYCIDRIVPDSACTSTAYLSGVKGMYGTIGFNGGIKRKNCDDTLDKNKYTQSIAKLAQDNNMATGFVTTTRVTHATPAGLYAHVTDRNWENDDEVKKSCGTNRTIDDIAIQLIHSKVGENFRVIFGGGRQEFHDQKKDTEQNKPGLRKDGRNLIEEWQYIAQVKKENAKYIYTKQQLEDLKVDEIDKVMGLFNYDHMPYRMEMDTALMPSLADMTKKAVEVLKSKGKENGFFLFVEGGKIDLAHHNVRAKLAFNETLELAKAVQMAKEMTNDEDTLIVVTSDHSHTMTISGNAPRNNDIFGTTGEIAKDGFEYRTLSYGNGKAFSDYHNEKINRRGDPKEVDVKEAKAEFPSTIKKGVETHGGDDVAVYANGPWSHLFTGVYEQNVIPHLICYAACCGKYLKSCDAIQK